MIGSGLHGLERIMSAGGGNYFWAWRCRDWQVMSANIIKYSPLPLGLPPGINTVLLMSHTNSQREEPVCWCPEERQAGLGSPKVGMGLAQGLHIFKEQVYGSTGRKTFSFIVRQNLKARHPTGEEIVFWSSDHFWRPIQIPARSLWTNKDLINCLHDSSRKEPSPSPHKHLFKVISTKWCNLW